MSNSMIFAIGIGGCILSFIIGMIVKHLQDSKVIAEFSKEILNQAKLIDSVDKEIRQLRDMLESNQLHDDSTIEIPNEFVMLDFPNNEDKED